MWGGRYWGARYFGAALWGKVGAEPPVPTDFYLYVVPSAGLTYTVPSGADAE